MNNRIYKVKVLKDGMWKVANDLNSYEVALLRCVNAGVFDIADRIMSVWGLDHIGIVKCLTHARCCSGACGCTEYKLKKYFKYI